MGGCESCASGRRKEVALFLNEKMLRGNPSELKAAIEKAEACGLETLPARRQFSELERLERQSPERVHEMVRWAMSTQDGVILYNVIQEVSAIAPDHPELRVARQRLMEHQEDAKIRLQRLARNSDPRNMTMVLDRARGMGIPPGELAWVEQVIRNLEEIPITRTGGSLRIGPRPSEPRGGQAAPLHN
mmetsp:Transcript_11762/g.36908  ORF Transcript_11762/g.36908 Transcript_11762/m.36908 type:complete len:188 (+) Transcript_11762:58-621(+)